MLNENPRRETKVIGGHVLETKEGNDNGVPIGIIAGYIATWDIDEGNDRFKRGAFKEALREHREDRNNRKIRMNYNHWDLIGGFPVDGDNPAKEDSRGLFGEGHVVLSDPLGRKTYDLARSGVLVDFSVGYSAKEFSFKEVGPDKIRVREIQTSGLWEGSIVDEPMNRRASITAVKRALSLAEAGAEWSEYQGADERAFLPACGIAIGSEVDGKLVLVPDRLEKVAAEMIELGDPDLGDVALIERHLASANIDSPFPLELRSYFRTDEVLGLTQRQIQGALHRSGVFSKGASRLLSEKLAAHLANETDIPKEGKAISEIAESLDAMRKALGGVTVSA